MVPKKHARGCVKFVLVVIKARIAQPHREKFALHKSRGKKFREWGSKPPPPLLLCVSCRLSGITE